MTAYIALLHKEQGSDYGVSFPDFPGCVTAGKSLEEARRLAREALEFHIEGMLEDGEPVPEATSLDEIVKDKTAYDAVHFLVDLNVAELAGPAERINISVPKKALRYIDEAAAAAGESRSAYLVRSAVMVGRHAAQAVRERDARTGQFVDVRTAKGRPATTVVKGMPLPARKTKKK